MVAFDAALAAGEAAHAVRACAGPLLDGFFLSNRPNERWVERERVRLAGLQTKALESLAENAEAGN